MDRGVYQMSNSINQRSINIDMTNGNIIMVYVEDQH